MAEDQNRFERLLRPRAIAIAGASPDANSLGGMPLAALRRARYPGALYPVNAAHTSIAGQRCFPSIDSVPSPCDVAVVAVPAGEVAGVVAACDTAGIGFAVILSAGFSEAGKRGEPAQTALDEVRRTARIRVLGPNCQGFLNVKDRVPAGYSSIFELPALPSAGPIAMVTQGGFGFAIAGLAEEQGLGIHYVVSTGNELDIAAEDLLDYFLDRDDVAVVWAFLQTAADGRRLAEVGAKALRVGKPILVWKVGNSESGRRAAMSHTGILGSDYQFYRAAFRRGGFMEVFDPESLFDITRAWSSSKVPAGASVAIISISGAQAIAVMDRCESAGLTLAELGEATERRVADLLPGLGAVNNPLDVTRQVIRDPRRFGELVGVVMDDPAVDQVVVCNGAIHGAPARDLAQVLATISRAAPKPLLLGWAPRPGAATEALSLLSEAGIPCFSSPSRLAVTAGALASFACKQRSRSAPPSPPLRRGTLDLPASGGVLGERLAKRVLNAYGIPVVREVLLTRSECLSLTALPFEPPLAVKVSSPDILHKTEAGLVRLGLTTVAAVRAAADEILDAADALPGVRTEGVLVQEMADGLEVMLGALNDRSFGPMVTFGLGGIWVEALGDVAMALAPLDTDAARDLIDETRGAALLRGARGKPILDVDALALALSQLSWLVADHADRIAEVDVNPLFVRAAGLGVVAADALVVLRGDETIPALR